MTNTELIKALRCGGHNMIFHYCDKEDCPYCQYSYYENLHRCNVQELGIDAADALEAADKKIAELEKELEIWTARSFEGKIGSMALINLNLRMEISKLEAQLPKEGVWKCAYPEIEPNPMFMYGICSICGFEQNISNKLNYCPNCGARMKGEHNDKCRID